MIAQGVKGSTSQGGFTEEMKPKLDLQIFISQVRQENGTLGSMEKADVASGMKYKIVWSELSHPTLALSHPGPPLRQLMFVRQIHC